LQRIDPALNRSFLTPPFGERERRCPVLQHEAETPRQPFRGALRVIEG